MVCWPRRARQVQQVDHSTTRGRTSSHLEEVVWSERSLREEILLTELVRDSPRRAIFRAPCVLVISSTTPGGSSCTAGNTYSSTPILSNCSFYKSLAVFLVFYIEDICMCLTAVRHIDDCGRICWLMFQLINMCGRVARLLEHLESVAAPVAEVVSGGYTGSLMQYAT